MGIIPKVATQKEKKKNNNNRKASRLAHLYGLPKTHKERLCMRPILSATGTYNYPLAKWLDEKLKPVSTNKYCINNIFDFIDEIKNISIEPNHILVSYDVSALFTNVPLKETIGILVDKAFEGDWFNKMHSVQLQKHQLMDLLEIATTNQLFQFNSKLYEQTDGVAMGELTTGATIGQRFHVPYRRPTRAKEHDSVFLSQIC